MVYFISLPLNNNGSSPLRHQMQLSSYIISHITNENMAANSEDQDVKADGYHILSIMCVYE